MIVFLKKTNVRFFLQQGHFIVLGCCKILSWWIWGYYSNLTWWAWGTAIISEKNHA